MVTSVLHTGASHPDLLWILVPSVLAFAAGLGIAKYADRLKTWLGTDASSSTN